MRTEEIDRGAPTDDAALAQVDGAGVLRPAPSRTAWVVATVAVLVAAAAAVVAFASWQQQRVTETTIADVEAAAGGFALELTTWDASDGMGDTREALRAAGTGTFAGDVDQLFGGTDDLATLEEVGARSQGEVQDVLVQRVDGDTSQALAVVVQRVTTAITEGEEVSLRYARLGLLREGGDWRIDSVELVVDALQETATRTDLGEVSGAAPDPEGGG